MMPSPAELSYFLEVASTRNISRAAERLGVSQPTLSLAIRRLEDSIGSSLLIRTKSGVELTKNGHKLMGQARSLLESWERLKKGALDGNDSITGVYTIGCHPSVGVYSLGFLTRLLGDNPGLEVKLIHDLSRKITEQVVSFQVDFGLVVNPIQHPDLVIRNLLSDAVGFWTAPTPTKSQNPFSGEGVLICDPELLQTQALMKRLHAAGAKFSRTISSSNLEVIASLVAEGTGVGILPGLVAGRSKGMGLVRLANLPKFEDRVALVYRADAQSTGTGRYLAKQIELSFKRGKRSKGNMDDAII